MHNVVVTACYRHTLCQEKAIYTYRLLCYNAIVVFKEIMVIKKCVMEMIVSKGKSG